MEGTTFLVAIFGVFSLGLAADPLCEGVPSDVVILFPYPGDCSKYYECSEGNKYEMNCPSGLWFNEAVQSCDHPEHSGCIQTSVAPTSTSTSSPMCPPGIVDYWPYPYDCSKYYECYDGRVELHSCPADLWFNSIEKRCVSQEDSACISTSSISPTYTTPDGACWGVLPGVTELKPYPGDCNRFIECYGATRTDMICPPHLYFNKNRQLCDWPAASGCDDTTASPPTGTTEDGSTPTPPTTPNGDDDPRCADGNTSYWPHPICTMYVECYRGHGYTMDCPSGLYFDSVDKMCKDPSQSDCGTTSPAPDPSTSTKGGDWTPDPQCPWPPTSDRYLFPYPGDCTKFYECAVGEKVVQNCPDNLWFNPNLLVCDYPYHSGCIYA